MTKSATATTEASGQSSDHSPPSNNSSKTLDQNYHRLHRRPVRSAVTWLESLRVPKALQRGGDKAGSDEGTPIISGLDRVLFGKQPACEAVLICGIHPPRYLCYMLSGFICDVIQFCIDLTLHKVFLLEDPSVCWALGFGMSVAFRHTSHRYLVFGDYVGGYWSSLGRMYAAYSIIIVISTLFNIVMTHYLQLPHYLAWVVTLLWTGIVNYFILKKLWSFGGKEKREDEHSNENHNDVEMMREPQRENESRLQARNVDNKR